MELPDGTILLHAGKPYDPAKAHDYYVRTRKLKGRRKGRALPASANSIKGKKLPSSNKNKALVIKDIKAQKKSAAARVEVLKKKLSLLNAELKKRMSAARKSEQKSRKAKSEAKKPDTAAEKSKQARDAKKYRSKNQQKISTKAKQAASKEPKATKSKKPAKADSVEELKKTIDRVQKSLADAIAKQRALG